MAPAQGPVHTGPSAGSAFPWVEPRSSWAGGLAPGHGGKAAACAPGSWGTVLTGQLPRLHRPCPQSWTGKVERVALCPDLSCGCLLLGEEAQDGRCGCLHLPHLWQVSAMLHSTSGCPAPHAGLRNKVFRLMSHYLGVGDSAACHWAV